MLAIDARFRALKHVADTQLAVAPEQQKFFAKRFASSTEQDLVFLEGIASQIERLTGDNLTEHARDYAWLCAEQLEEELYWRRNGKYRYSLFSEALENVYANAAYMKKYMNGLLMTQLWWSNHSAVIAYYVTQFLPGNKEGYSHLEIGPGHGLFLYLAASDPRCGSLTGWDISQTSIDMTRAALAKMQSPKMPALELVDLFKGPRGSFDSLVLAKFSSTWRSHARRWRLFAP